MIDHIPFAGLVASRWKNGAGSKRDIAQHDLADGTMAWMFGLADIETDAPFSHFDGARRWFSVVSDGQVALDIDTATGRRDTVLLDRHSAPFAFAGDLPTACRLLSDPVRVFNVMTAGPPRAVTVTRQAPAGPLRLPVADGQVVLVLVTGGTACARAGGTTLELGTLDSLLAQGDEPTLVIEPGPGARLIVAALGD